MERREFMKKAALSGAALAGLEFGKLAMPVDAGAYASGGGIGIEEIMDTLAAGKAKNLIPQIRPEILAKPRAVFLIQTRVRATPNWRGFFTDARPELMEIGKSTASTLFVKGTQKGGSTMVKPNFTNMYLPDGTYNPACGMITSPDFVAGFIQGMRELGNTNIITGDRGSGALNHRQAGIYTIMDQYNIPVVEPMYEKFAHYTKNELNWNKVPNPVVWKSVPTYRPIGDPDNLFINMPKLKNHNLGLTTLSIKNLQGAVPTGYGHYCNRWSDLESLMKHSYMGDFDRDFVKNYYENVEAAFLKHRAAGFKYWDYEQLYSKYEAKGGWQAFRKVKDDLKARAEFTKDLGSLMWDEMWTQRALDSARAVIPAINIVEGIIGRDGSGFDTGTDQLCNIIIVGLSKVEVDSVASWIMGHNPSILPYTRVAKELGMGECDIDKIEMNWIDRGTITPVKNVSEIRRYKLGVNLHTWAETGKRLFWD
jgi:uncharacterized protein (DUF362 family)